MGTLTIRRANLKRANVNIFKSTGIPSLIYPGTVDVDHSTVRRFRAGEIFLLHLISPTGKTKVTATAFHTGWGTIYLDGARLEKYLKRGGRWKEINCWWNRAVDD